MRARFLLAAVFLISLSMGCLPGTDFKVSLRIIDADTGEPVKDAWVLVGAYLSIEPPLEPPYNVGLGATRGLSDHKGLVRFKRLEGMYEGEKPQDPLWKMLESRQPKITRRIKGVKGGSIVLFAPGYGAVHQPFGISDNPDFQKELRERNLKPEEYVGWFGEGPEDWNYKPLFLKIADLKAKKTITLKVRKPKNPEHRFASFQPEVLWYSAIATSWRTGTSVKEKERIYEFFKEQMKYAAEVSDNPFYKAQWEALKDPEQKKEFIAFTIDKTYESLESDPIPAIPADFRNTRLSRVPAPAPQPEPEIHNHDTTVHVWMTKKALELLPEEYEEIREHEADIIDGVRAEDSVLRVLKHFYNPHDPEAGYGNNDTALKWGAIGYPDHPKNEWDWEDALRYYREGDKKKAYKALGHVLHLLEDLSVPMHTRKIRHVYYLDAAAEFELYFARLAKQNGGSLPNEYGEGAKRPKLVTGVAQPFEAVAKLTFGEFERNGKTVRFADYYAWEAGKNGRLVKKPDTEAIELMGKHLLPRAIEYSAGLLGHFYGSLNPKSLVQVQDSTIDTSITSPLSQPSERGDRRRPRRRAKELVSDIQKAKSDVERDELYLAIENSVLDVDDDVRSVYKEMRRLAGKAMARKELRTRLRWMKGISRRLSSCADAKHHKIIAELLEDEARSQRREFFAPWRSSSEEDAKEKQLEAAPILALITAARNGGNRQALPALRKVFRQGGIAAELAENAIGEIGDPQDLEEFVSIIWKNPETRIDLGPFGERAIKRLMRDVDDPSTPPKIRRRLIASLASPANPGMADHFVPLLGHKDAKVVEVAAQGLSASLTQDDAKLIYRLIQHKNAHVRLAAVQALGEKTWSGDAIPAMINILKDDADTWVRAEAARFLGQHGVMEAAPSLTAALGDKSQWVRSAARTALVKLGIETATENE